jgi:hypothetical protein
MNPETAFAGVERIVEILETLRLPERCQIGSREGIGQLARGVCFVPATADDEDLPRQVAKFSTAVERNSAGIACNV